MCLNWKQKSPMHSSSPHAKQTSVWDWTQRNTGYTNSGGGSDLTHSSLRKEQKYALNYSSLNDNKTKPTFPLLSSAWAQSLLWQLLLCPPCATPALSRVHEDSGSPCQHWTSAPQLPRIIWQAHTGPIFPSHLNPGSRAGDVRVAKWYIYSGYFQLLKSPWSGCRSQV